MRHQGGQKREGAPTTVPIRDELELFEARRVARRMAQALGFPLQAREELVIVVSELGSNILKYGVAGDITVEAVDGDEHGVGLAVTARDVGPPFADFALALTDGYSDRGPIDPVELLHRKGFGAGLGAVARFSDRFEYQPGSGEKRIRVVRYLRAAGAKGVTGLLILKVLHVAASAVWIGGGLTASHDVRRTLSLGPPHSGQLLPRLRTTATLMNGSALLTVVTGLGLVFAAGGFARMPHRIDLGIALTLLAIGVGRLMIRPVIGEIAQLAKEPGSASEIDRVARRFSVAVNLEHLLRWVVLVLMIYPFSF